MISIDITVEGCTLYHRPKTERILAKTWNWGLRICTKVRFRPASKLEQSSSVWPFRKIIFCPQRLLIHKKFGKIQYSNFSRRHSRYTCDRASIISLINVAGILFAISDIQRIVETFRVFFFFFHLKQPVLVTFKFELVSLLPELYSTGGPNCTWPEFMLENSLFVPGIFGTEWHVKK